MLRFLKLGTLAHPLVPLFHHRGLSSCFVHSRSLANVSDKALGKGTGWVVFFFFPVLAKCLQEVGALLSLLGSPLHLRIRPTAPRRHTVLTFPPSANLMS